MRVLVASEQDIASLNIRSVLENDYGFTDSGKVFEGNPILSLDRNTLLVTAKQDMIQCENLEKEFKAEVFIFCSRHRAKSGKPALLVHSTGNLGPEAAFGGNPNELSVSTASLVAAALKRLHQERNKRSLHQFDVTLEVTHHGPTSMNTPLLFIELGSNQAYWSHEEGAKAVAAAAMDCALEPFVDEAAIGFGGTHYASKFNRLVLEKNVRIGHMAPRYALDNITSDLLQQMVKRAQETVNTAILDWKGTNLQQRKFIIPILEDMGLRVIRAKHM